MATSTQPPKSKSISWAAALQQEIRKTSGFTPEHKSIKEIRAELKAAGLPCGSGAVYRYVGRLIAAGKAEKCSGVENGYYQVKYLLK